MHISHIIHDCDIKHTCFNFYVILSPSDPTLTVENVLGVMEKVTDGRAEKIWRRLIGSTVLKDISSKCSTERELVNVCADIYVNCDPDSSWEGVALGLHHEGETAAVEEVQSYLNPRGRFSQWVWFVVEIYLYSKVHVISPVPRLQEKGKKHPGAYCMHMCQHSP